MSRPSPSESEATRRTPGEENASLLGRAQFRHYWLARLAGQTAQGALLYGMLVLVVDQTEKSIWAALFVVCSIVPSLAFGLVGGWVTDRLPQRALLIWLSLARAGIVALLLLVDLRLAVIFAVTLGIWTVHQFFSPTETAVMPRLIEIDDLPAGAALSNLALTLSQVLGMVILAPLLLRMPSERYLFAACAVLYALAGLFYLRMGALSSPPRREHRPLSLRRGWRAVADDRHSYSAMIDLVLIGIGTSALVVIIPQYLVRVLDTSASNTVFVFAPAIVGVVIGLHSAPRLGRRFGYGKIATAGLLGFAAAVACFGIINDVINILNAFRIPLDDVQRRFDVSQRVIATMLLSIPAGFCSALTHVGARTVLLERTPADLRGQVFATQSTIQSAGALVPALLAGVAIDQIGVQPVAFVVAVLLVVTAVIARRLDMDDAPGEAATAASPADAGVLRFARAAAGLKQVRRQGWIDRGVSDPESSADHSWSVALLAWLLARDRTDLDRERVLLLGLVHDLPEARAGDTTPFDAARDASGRIAHENFRTPPVYSAQARRAKDAREQAALDEMLADLPPGMAHDIRDAWGEYAAGTTAEARFVRQVDKLETLNQAELYREEQPQLVIESFLLGARRDVSDSDLARLIEGIVDASPRPPTAEPFQSDRPASSD